MMTKLGVTVVVTIALIGPMACKRSTPPPTNTAAQKVFKIAPPPEATQTAAQGTSPGAVGIGHATTTTATATTTTTGTVTATTTAAPRRHRPK